MKADEEEEEERHGRIGMRWDGVNWDSREGATKNCEDGEGSGVNWDSGEGATKNWEGGEGSGVNWGEEEEVSTITLHVTEHTVTVRLEARYTPSSGEKPSSPLRNREKNHPHL